MAGVRAPAFFMPFRRDAPCIAMVSANVWTLLARGDMEKTRGATGVARMAGESSTVSISCDGYEDVS